MDNEILIPYIITATVSLVGIIATSAVSIVLNNNNFKRDILKQKHDYHLKLLLSSLQEKKEMYVKIYNTISKSTDIIIELSAEVHQNKHEFNSNHHNQTKSKFLERFKHFSLKLKEQKDTVFLLASSLCDHYFTIYYIILDRIERELKASNNLDSFFMSKNCSKMIDALQNSQGLFLEQVRIEIDETQSITQELYFLNVLDKKIKAHGRLIIQNKKNIILLAGSRTTKPLDNDYWNDMDDYITSKNKEFNTIEEATSYLTDSPKNHEWIKCSYFSVLSK